MEKQMKRYTFVDILILSRFNVLNTTEIMIQFYQINRCTFPGSDSHLNGREINIHNVTKLIISYHPYSKIPHHLACLKTEGDKCNLQKQYGNTKYRNSSNGLGTIVKAVHAMIPRRNNADWE
jgi:hypothetical protein